MFNVYWTGNYPCLCHGEWQIFHNGENVSSLIPEELAHSEMNTYGSYSRWFFDENYSESAEFYNDGLTCEDWIAQNREWIANICESEEEMIELFSAIQENDWRHESCGGCI